jgi:hypothetical protein
MYTVRRVDDVYLTVRLVIVNYTSVYYPFGCHNFV